MLRRFDFDNSLQTQAAAIRDRGKANGQTSFTKAFNHAGNQPMTF
jgi:hypothetical protein